MPAKKTKKQLADEAYLRNLQLELPQEAERERMLPLYDKVPAECPSCKKRMGVLSGWALVFGDILQCGGCGFACQVPRPEYERLARAIHDAHPHGDGYKPPPKTRGPKSRGAG